MMISLSEEVIQALEKFERKVQQDLGKSSEERFSSNNQLKYINLGNEVAEKTNAWVYANETYWNDKTSGFNQMLEDLCSRLDGVVDQVCYIADYSIFIDLPFTASRYGILPLKNFFELENQRRFAQVH